MQEFNTKHKPLLLVFPYEVMAHYLRCIELCSYLRAYFHIKFVYSHRFQNFISAAGFETFRCASLDAEKVQRCVASFDFSWLNEKDLNYIYEDQVKTINELQPTAILGDMCPTLSMAAEKTGTFCFSLINGYMSQFYAYSRRMPRKYPLYELFNLLPESLFQYFTNVGERLFFQQIHSPFRKIRQRNNLSIKSSYIEELEGDANLICDLQELFPQKKLPSNYFVIPPLFYKSAEQTSGVMEKLHKNKKTIYVSMGSTGSWKNVSFLNDRKYYKYNVVTAGDYEQVVEGPHVFSYAFINIESLLAATDVVICHGGNGTIYQALSHGIPLLCKTSHLEQDYNVDALERLHLGRSLNNVFLEEEYGSIIEEWISKKGSQELSFIRSKIAEAASNFEDIIDNLLKTCFDKVFCREELVTVK